jgi:DNA (cytosine-5)-methyltransferase 1
MGKNGGLSMKKKADFDCEKSPHRAIVETQQAKLPADAPTFVDLFCGCGGASCGILESGEFRHLCGIDLNRMALKTYQFNLGNAVMADIRYLPLRDDLEPTLVWFSPPCQGFSSINTKKRDEKGNLKPRVRMLRNLTMYAALAIEYLRPEFILMENVPPTEHSKEFREMTFFLQHESTTIYQLTWKVINFADYGVPQTRHRLIMMGRKDVPMAMIEMPADMSIAQLNMLTLPDTPMPKDPLQSQLFEFALEVGA